MSTPSRRKPLTRDRVVRAAVRIVDQRGLDGLTMRALGRALGVDAMAVYHHVPHKAALLEAVVEAIWSDVEVPQAEGAWRDQLADLARALRAALRRHPNALPLLATRQDVSPAGLAVLDRAIAVLASAGLAPAAALHVASAGSAFVIGHVLAEVGAPPGGVGDVDPARFVAASEDLAGELPHLAAALRDGAIADAALDETFEVGLALLVAGAERLVEAA